MLEEQINKFNKNERKNIDKEKEKEDSLNQNSFPKLNLFNISDYINEFDSIS